MSGKGTALAGWDIAFVAGTALAATATYFLIGYASRRSKDKRPPHHATMPLVGDAMFKIMKHGSNYYHGLIAKYGPTFSINLMLRRTVVFTRYEDIKALMAAEHDLVESEFPDSVRTLLGPWSITALEFDAHLKMRKALAPIAAPAALRAYLPQVQQLCEETVEQWLKNGGGQAYTDIKQFTFRVIMDVVIGFDSEYGKRLSSTWLNFSSGLFSLPFSFPGSPYSRAKAARQKLLLEISQLIAAKRQQRARVQEASGAEPAAAAAGASALDLLLGIKDEQGLPLTEEQLLDTLLVLGFAGHDTTATAISRALWLLAQHPAVLAQLRAEQAQVVAAYGAQLGDAALRDCPYLEAVVKEVLRHQVVIAAVFRRALKDFQLAGFNIPSGSHVLLSLAPMMEKDERWAHLPADSPLAPQHFAPERWLPGGGAEGSRAAGWLPFGAGARMCLGYPLAMAETKIFLAVVARRASWQLVDPEERWNPFPLPAPCKGLPLRVQPAQE